MATKEQYNERMAEMPAKLIFSLESLPGPDAVDNLKTIAVSRLMLDNFDHIKAYWVMLGKATSDSTCRPR